MHLRSGWTSPPFQPGTCATLQVVQRGCRLELYSSEGGKFPPLKAAGGWKTSLVVSSTNKRPKEMGEKKLQKIQMVSFLDSGKSAGTIFGNEKGWPFSILAPESIQNKELSGDPWQLHEGWHWSRYPGRGYEVVSSRVRSLVNKNQTNWGVLRLHFDTFRTTKYRFLRDH